MFAATEIQLAIDFWDFDMSGEKSASSYSMELVPCSHPSSGENLLVPDEGSDGAKPSTSLNVSADDPAVLRQWHEIMRESRDKRSPPFGRGQNMTLITPEEEPPQAFEADSRSSSDAADTESADSSIQPLLGSASNSPRPLRALLRAVRVMIRRLPFTYP